MRGVGYDLLADQVTFLDKPADLMMADAEFRGGLAHGEPFTVNGMDRLLPEIAG
jgi:hypothetical protein